LNHLISFPMFRNLPPSALPFVLHLFNLSWSSHSFSSVKVSHIIPVLKPRKNLRTPSSFRPISLTSGFSRLFERLILSRASFFTESHSYFLRLNLVFALSALPLTRSLFFLPPFHLVSSTLNLIPALFSALSIFPVPSTLFGTGPFFSPSL